MEVKDGKNIEKLFTGSVVDEDDFTFDEKQYVVYAVRRLLEEEGEAIAEEKEWAGTIEEFRERILHYISLDHKTFMDYHKKFVQRAFRRMEAFVGENRRQIMQEVRSKQVEKDPSNPVENEFGKRLLFDIDEELGQFISEDLPGVSDVNDGEKFELRFYSGSDTVLDYTKGMDCWVELFDLENNRVSSMFVIDITINPEHPPTSANELLLVSEEEDVDVKARGKIAPAFFESKKYKDIKSEVLKSFCSNAEVQRVKRAMAA